MASSTPMSIGGKNHDFTLPIPPPLLHTRSSNSVDGQRTPGTPIRHGDDAFISPVQTPQGSPSKSNIPPGAYDLPNVFDNAMKLMPTQGSNKQAVSKQPLGNSPNKGGFDDGQAWAGAPGSPTRKTGKENTPPTTQRPQLQQKESSFINQAAQSRAAPYQEPASPTRQKQTIGGGLTPEDVEKLQKASVKRLANVTQLCESSDCHTKDRLR